MKLKVGSEITDTTYEKYERNLQFMIEFLKNEFKSKNFLLAKIDKQYLKNEFEILFRRILL